MAKLAKGTKFYWGDGGAGAVKASSTLGSGASGLVLTAKTAGTAGNSTTRELLAAGTASLAVSVIGTAITITLGTTSGTVTSTVNDVIAKIIATPAALALVDPSAVTTGTGLMAAAASAALSGGSNSAEVFADIPGVGDINLDPGSYNRMDITSHSSPGPQPEMINEAFTSEGTASFSLNWKETDAGHLALEADFEANTQRNAKIEPPAGGGKTRTFVAQIMSLGEAYPVKGVITRDVSIGILGSITKV